MLPAFSAIVFVLGQLSAAVSPACGGEEEPARRSFALTRTLTVPGAGVKPTRQEETFDFVLPEGFEVDRDAGSEHGLRLKEENLDGMSKRVWTVEPIDRGVRIHWRVRNTKVTERTAKIVVERVGLRNTNTKLSEQYREMRERFVRDFYFDGLVAEWVDPKADGGHVKFADQTLYMGQALLVFASEVAILRDTGGDTTDAIARISVILDAFDKLDLTAEAHFGAEPLEEPNGFFVRDDVSGPDDPRLKGRFQTVDSDWQGKRNEAAPSGDQIFGMMFGLWAVEHWTENKSCRRHAARISSRLYDYARRSNFELKLPNGKTPKRGADLQWQSSLLHGLNQSITGEDLFRNSKIEIAGIKTGLQGIASAWDNRHVQDLIHDNVDKSIDFAGFKVEVHSFALHMMLMSLATSEVWPQDVLEKVASKSHHPLAVLLYCRAHNTLPKGFTQEEIQSMLDACPDEGPSASAPRKSGWNHDNRWVRCTKLGERTDGSRQYNGLDWMALHNLAELVYSGH